MAMLKETLAGMDVCNLALLALCTLLCCACALRPSNRPEGGVAAGAGDRSGYTALLLLIILAAVAVRIYRFGQVPAGFNQDGAMAAVDAKALADHGTDRLGMRWPVHLTAWSHGQMSALMSYMMVPLIKLFGLSAVTARLPVLLASLGGLACLYLFSRDVFGKNAALVIFFFAAIDPWHIVQSRWALDCNLFPHFFMAGVYFLNRGAAGKKYNIAVSMLMFGLCMYCYGISIYTVPVFLLAACIYLLAAKRIKIRHALMALAVYLLVAWPFIAVMAINYFKLATVATPFFTLPYFSESVRSSDILLFSPNICSQLMENFKTLAGVVLLQRADLPWNEVRDFGSTYLFSLPFAAVGLASLLRRSKGRSGCALLLLFLLTGGVAGLLTNSVNINRVNIIFYPMIFLCGIGIWRVMLRLGRWKWTVAAVYAAAFAMFTYTYFTSYAGMMADLFYADFCAAVASVEDDGAEKFYITADTQSKGSDSVSQILTLFWLKTDALYFQGVTPEGETPFKEKYIFKSMDALDIDPGEDAVYVAAEADIPLFDAALFDFESFGSYYVVRPK